MSSDWFKSIMKEFVAALDAHMPPPGFMNGGKFVRTKSIGFWCTDTSFSTLPHPSTFLDLSWDKKERDKVIKYLRNGNRVSAYLGYSWCRFQCGEPVQNMGSADLSDGVYLWPEGYAHYLEKHHVKPPEDFVRHVLKRSR